MAERPSGGASLWECRAARSRQARAEEAQEPSCGTAKKGALAVLPHSACLTRHKGLQVVKA